MSAYLRAWPERVMVVLLATSLLWAGEGITIQMSPQGNDAGDGSTVPVASLIGARDAIRRLRASGSTGPVRVTIAAGTYRFTEPLILEPQDGGTAEAPVVYEAAPGARPVFSGGRLVAGFQRMNDGSWSTKIPEVATGAWKIEQLYVDDRRAERVRQPERFWFSMQAVDEEILEQGSGRVPKRARQKVRLHPDDARSLSQLSPNELKQVQFVVYHNWTSTRRFIEDFDPATSTLTVSGTGMPSWNPWKPNTPCILENCRSEQEIPGRWHLTADGTLTYWPLPGQEPGQAHVVAPLAERFVIIRGTTAKPVAHLAFVGLSWRHGSWQTPPTGVEPRQAAANIDAAIQADGASHLTFERCEIAHLGRHGIWFRSGCVDNTLRQCHLHDLGAGGIRIGEENAEMNPAEPTARNRIDNCLIRNGGVIHPSAAGIWIGSSPDNAVIGNDIGDLYYTGISVGWRWGYLPSTCKRNRIIGNHIHHLGRGPLSDLGGIYTLGPSEGTLVKGNVIHDIHSFTYGGWGLYTDEGSTGITFEDNLVYRTKDGSFHQHYGRDNIIRNNILLDSGERQIALTRSEPHRSFTFTRNIIQWRSGPALTGPWDKANTETGANCWFNLQGAPVRFLGKELAAWQASGHEIGSVVADPRLADPARGDFSLKPDSPALALGFKPFYVHLAGLSGDPAWVALGKKQDIPPYAAPPKPRPIAVHADFEGAQVGSPPKGVEIQLEQVAGAAVVVTDATAAEGKQSLKLVDAPGMKETWQPHLAWRVQYTAGTATSSFWVRIEKSSVLRIAWRDYQSVNPAATGAFIQIKDCRLRFGDTRSLVLPEQQWVRITMRGELGQERGAWNLEVAIPGQPVQTVPAIPYAHPAFRSLTWFGVMSEAHVASTCFLDGVDLDVR